MIIYLDCLLNGKAKIITWKDDSVLKIKAKEF